MVGQEGGRRKLNEIKKKRPIKTQRVTSYRPLDHFERIAHIIAIILKDPIVGIILSYLGHSCQFCCTLTAQ